MNKQIRLRQRRFRFTINNPFITDDIKIVDLNALTDEQQTFEKTDNDYAFLKQQKNIDFFDFAVTEYDKKEKGETVGKLIGERAFFKDYKSAQEYFKTIDYIDYICFQYEKGESGTKHLQGFMHFKKPMDFTSVKTLFPTIHLDKCHSTNYECRAYCQKPETAVEGYGFFEYGSLPQEGERVDMQAFKQDVIENVPFSVLFEKYPYLAMNNVTKIVQVQQRLLEERYENTERDIHVTYIYGIAGAGKTTYPRRVLGYQPKQICKVIDHGNGKFDEYNAHEILLFDEFYSQIKVTQMNDYLSGEPSFLPARYNNRVACFTKVFIISNYPPEDQYKKERAAGMEPSFVGFMRRINEVIYMPRRNVYVWQKGYPTNEIIKTISEQKGQFCIEEKYHEQEN